MPAVPSCIIDPLREEFLARLPHRHVHHPLGCHRPRVPDAVVFDKLVQALVFGCGYERLADATCSASTMRRRRDEWIAAGVFEALRIAALDAYEAMIGLDLADVCVADVCVDGCITKAPCGGERWSQSGGSRQARREALAVDRRRRRAVGHGCPGVSAPANVPDHALLPATLDALKDWRPLPAITGARTTVHLDAGYDYRPCRAVLADRHLVGEIAQRGLPAPIQIGKRWVVERTNAWFNDFGKIRRCTERRAVCVDAYLALAAAIVTVRALLRAAWYSHRWDTRPRSPRIR